MPTSATCRPADRARGFTLLELLIVLAIIAGAAALVAPRLQATYDAIVLSSARAQARDALERLPLAAREAGRDLRFEAGRDGTARLATYLALPEGWRVEPLEPLVVRASGMCEAARVAASYDDRAPETWQVSAPFCQVDDGSGT